MPDDDYRSALAAAIAEYEDLGARRREIDDRLSQLAQTIGTLTKLLGLTPTVPLGLTDACRLALRGAGDPGPALLPDDTIQLVDKPIAVAVRGDVARPGTVYLDVDEPLSQALLQVGGPNATATETQITLTRNGASRQVTIGSPIFSQPAQNGDVLTFPRAPRVDVLGTVEKPGSTSLRGDATLVAALYYAGGPAAHANLKSVQVIHDGRRKTYDLAKLQKGDTGENPTLVDGDVVFVPQGSTFDWSQIWQAIGALGLFGLHI